MKTVRLKHVVVHFDKSYVRTVFKAGGAVADAHPHFSPHYFVVSHRCGYGDDVAAYCFEHEVAHSYIAEHFTGGTSAVLRALALGEEPDHYAAIREECMAQLLQRYARAGEEPIVSGVDWAAMRDGFLSALAGEPA